MATLVTPGPHFQQADLPPSAFTLTRQNPAMLVFSWGRAPHPAPRGGSAHWPLPLWPSSFRNRKSCHCGLHNTALLLSGHSEAKETAASLCPLSPMPPRSGLGNAHPAQPQLSCQQIKGTGGNRMLWCCAELQQQLARPGPSAPPPGPQNVVDILTRERLVQETWPAHSPRGAGPASSLTTTSFCQKRRGQYGKKREPVAFASKW